MRPTTLLAAAAGIAAMASSASADLYISEIYAGLSGPDGTADWFEVTWTGSGAFDTGSLYFEDDSMDPTNAGVLDSFVLSSGQSAVFLVDGGAADIADFMSIWGSAARVGLAGGGGGLGQDGDGVFLYDGNSAGANLVTAQSFFDNHNASLATWEFDAAGNARYSVLGENGAHESAAFANDSVSAPDDMVTLIGSPGAVPTPGALALLGLGGLVGSRRRR